MPRRKPEAVLRELGIEYSYTTSEVAAIFRKHRHWVGVNRTRGHWVDKDGQQLQPRMVEGLLIWSPQDVKDMAVSCYNRRTIDMLELKRIIRRLLRDEAQITNKYPTAEDEDD